jgi:hypothetical protein
MGLNADIMGIYCPLSHGGKPPKHNLKAHSQKPKQFHIPEPDRGKTVALRHFQCKDALHGTVRVIAEGSYGEAVAY